MAGSLQDQLKKAGLASAKQAAKAKRAQGLKAREAQRGRAVEDEAARLVREAEAAKVARDRELNRAAQEAREARAVQAQIRQIVEMNRVAERGSAEFRFTDGSTIRTLHVEEGARRALVAGRLGVVRLEAAGAGGEPRYELVPRQVAEKIAERDAARVVLLNAKGAKAAEGADEAPAEDDPYAGYEVPDDLMW